MRRQRRRVARWLPWVSWAGIAAGVTAIVLIATLPSRETVPGVVGRDRAVAAERVERAGLRVRAAEVEAEGPAGRVVAQRPRAGARVREGDTVTLVVSRAPRGPRVPDVSRLRAGIARVALERAGFWVHTARVPSSRTPAGRVVGTSPAASTRLDVGARVTLLVSSGPPRVRVPSVRGTSRSAAEERLLRAGFRVVIVRRDSLEPPGAVLAQSPAAGRRVRSNAVVRVAVAARPPPVAVPGVTGMPFEPAVSAVSGRGFAIAFDHRRARRGRDVGRVLAQRPAGGTRALRGTRVTLTLGVRR